MLPTPVLRLLNVLDDDYLENEEEYEDIVEDVKEECQKYGPVVSLLVPKENPGRGQVFVEYANAGDSKAAQKLLTGRMFDGKFVVATFYPLSAYRGDICIKPCFNPNLRTISCFSSSISWVILLHS